MTDKELLKKCQQFLNYICNNIGEVTTEYTWREVADLLSMIEENLDREPDSD